MWDEVHLLVPTDSAAQFTAEKMVEQVIGRLPVNATIIDLGCGTGRSADFFRARLPSCRWVGVDIADSPEVRARSRSGADFMEFDGVNIPLPDQAADLVFSRQSLEHVRYPEALLKDVARVLNTEGMLVGSTSHLEPYHSKQLWNFTPYGFVEICKTANLQVEELRPGIDGLTLVERTYKGRPKDHSVFFESESPLNLEIDEWARKTKRNVRQAIVRKLGVAGQFCFRCKTSR